MAPSGAVHTANKASNENEQSKYHLYGWRHLRFGGLLSRPLFAYIMLCACTFVQNFSVNGANNAVISTLERVFYLDSVQSGLFLALYDLATVFSAPLVGYLGNHYSSPIFFSLNMIIVGIGNLLIASSNSIHDTNTLNLDQDQLAQTSAASYNNILFNCYKDPFNVDNVTDTTCLEHERYQMISQNAKAVLYLGSVVNGIGSVALFTIGIAYIERIFPRDKAAYCQGIYFAVGTVGGALGIVVTGRFLLLYTKLTPRRRLPPWLTPSNPLWVGCWWLPYIIYGSLSIILGLFVSGLPNYEKPGTTHAQKSETLIPTLSAQHPHASLVVPAITEDDPTSITTNTNCPSTPALDIESSSVVDLKSIKNENGLATLDNLAAEYRLSHRRLRQVSPVPVATDPIDTNMSDGVINHAFSTETLYNQLPTTTTSSSSPPSTATPSDMASFEGSRSQKIKENFQIMWKVICELLHNTRFVFIIIANLFEGILLKGFVPFISKYFEYQHQLDTSTATLITGAIALLSVIVGAPIGAYFINRFSWTPMRCARVCATVFTLSSFMFLFLIFSCPELKFQSSSCLSSNVPCCHSIYHPVCNVDNPQKMYLSPCHYGCTNQTTASNDTSFYRPCHCASDVTVTLSETACRFRRIPCVTIFVLTLTGAAFVVFFTAFIQVPMLRVLLYSVPLRQQSMALGLRQTIVRVLGQTTGPLLFGFVFDQSCLVWLTDCYDRRTCKVYDNRRMGISMAMSGFCTRTITGIACFAVFLNWKFKHADDGEYPLEDTTLIAIPITIDKKESGETTRL